MITLLPQAMPEAAIQKLIATESIEKKWKMIQMNASVLSDSNMQAIRQWNNTDTDFLLQVCGSYEGGNAGGTTFIPVILKPQLSNSTRWIALTCLNRT